jgi:calcineurin-like phosphoesterase family protein
MRRFKVKQSDDQKVFWASDFHYGHANIVRGVSQWGDKEKSTRDFKTIQEMNDTLVNCINKTVRPQDVLFFGGDWAFGNVKNVAEFRRRIHCRNIHFVFGNHDDEIEEDETLQELFSSVQHYKEIAVDGDMICLFHYKQAIWNKSHRDAYHLYGHSHAGAEHMVIGKSMDIGVDNAFRLLGEYRPFTHEEVMYFLKGRKSHVVDHHGAKGTESHK